MGLTASSVASVSAEPPILALSLSSRSGSAGAVADAESIVIHLLSDANVGLAETLTPVNSRACPAESRCCTAQPSRCSRTPVGGSLLMAAQVEEVLETNDDSAPLVYHDRAFHRLGVESLLG